MKRIIFIITVIFAALPQSAHAGIIPWDTTFCAPQGVGMPPGPCATPTAAPGADDSVWIHRWTGAPQFVAGEWRQGFEFHRFHRYRRDWGPVDSFERVSDLGRFDAVTGAYLGSVQGTAVSVHPELNNADCGRVVGGNANDGPPRIVEAGPGLDGNPSMRHQCFPAVFGPAGEWLQQPVVDSVDPADPADPVAPAKAQTCAPIAVGKRKAAVTSVALACAPARTLLARYVQRGIEAPGYVCLKVRLGRQIVAKCAKPGRAAATVVGRWRV